MTPSEPVSIPVRIFRILSSLGLATTLLVILMLETWLATLEQTFKGLNETLLRYFNYQHWYVIPDAGIFGEQFIGKKLPPLPGGYWVCALLVLNLILGGIIRMRKGWGKAGILLAHFGIIFMVVSGGVTQYFETRGILIMREKQIADYAQDFIKTSIEIAQIKDGMPVGKVNLIDDQYYRTLEGQETRMVRLPALPFDLELQGYYRNGRPVPAAAMAPPNGEPVVDGWFFFSQPPGKETETDTPGIYVRIIPKDGSKNQVAILAVDSYQPLTIHANGQDYVMRLNKRIWPLPFRVRLDDARTTLYPNTTRAKAFESDVTRIEDGRESHKLIKMNDPMRYAGYTLFQRNLEHGEAGAKEATVSGFEVVMNPADKWPKWSIIIAGFGLLSHFLLKLIGFILGMNRRRPDFPQP